MTWICFSHAACVYSLKNWSATQYGEEVAVDAAKIYDDYFNIPHVHRGSSDEWIGATLGKLGGGGYHLRGGFRLSAK